MSKASIVFIACCLGAGGLMLTQMSRKQIAHAAEDPQIENAERMIHEGRKTFRFDTFGDEAFWGDSLKLHQAIEGAKFAASAPGVSPETALALGLKVDIDAVRPPMRHRMMHDEGTGLNRIRLNPADLKNPAVTLALLRDNAVVGLRVS